MDRYLVARTAHTSAITLKWKIRRAKREDMPLGKFFPNRTVLPDSFNASRRMNECENQDYGSLLKAFSTERLEGLLPALLKELRTRDSNHIKGDAITTSRTLRALRGTSKLPLKSP